jgi:hypothetical protein
MRRLVSVLLVTGLLLALAAPPSWAWHRGWHRGGTHVVIGLGPSFWWAPWWYYPLPVYVYAPPPVVVEDPPVYVQQEPSDQASSGYWYYCPSSRTYYPYVQSCPEPWTPVPAQRQ